MAHLSAKTSVPKDTLVALAESRLAESKVLQAGYPAASIYLGGYAVECYLKAAICQTLDLDELPNTFKSHVLDLLLMHSGLKRRLTAAVAVQRSFNKFAGLRQIEETEEPVRYASPAKYTNNDAAEFQKWLNDPHEGLIPWLKRLI